MSVVNIFGQRDCVHVAADSFQYTKSGIPVASANKLRTIPSWPAVVTNVGAVSCLSHLVPMLEKISHSFDDFIDRASYEDVLPRAVAEWSALLSEMGEPPTASEVLIAGISEKHGPRVYTFRTADDLPPGVTREEADASPFYPKRPAQLIALPLEISTPVPMAQVIPANWEGFDYSDDLETIHWKMRKLLEMQRAEFPSIGGFGTLATIYPDRIEQRILCRWPDELGQRREGASVDWAAWHRANPKPAAKRKLKVVK